MAILTSTYRLQFHAGFTFNDATEIVPYLHELGISHVYASPYLKSKAGSTHGYDVIDHGSINPEIGTQADYDAFVAALKARGMSQILDIVPNHVGVATNENAWWNDVLENGPDSAYARYFDIAWHASPRAEARDKLLLPVLGETYGKVLESGQLKLKSEPEEGAFSVWYYERRFPVSPHTYGMILRPDVGKDVEAEFQQLIEAAPKLTPAQIKQRLAETVRHKPQLASVIRKNVEAMNGTAGDPATFDALDRLLNAQHYRLACWKVAPDEINYRRFFDINDLAALSMDRQEVFEATHGLVLRLLAEGKLSGLRIDHPDGLYDPRRYFHRLREAANDPGLYVVVEKILAPGEALPEDWEVSGTTGYDFLALANGLFVDTGSEKEFTRIYQKFTGERGAYEDLVYENKRMILRRSFSSELHMLAQMLDRLAQRDRCARDFTLTGLRDALAEVVAAFPVYRSYITRGSVHETDRERVERAVDEATRRNPDISPELFWFIREMLLQRGPRGFTDDDREAQLRFAGKFQQLTAPVTAKGIEDTTFYNYNRLVSLNEVGGEPGHFGTPADVMHAYLRDRQRKWAGGLSPLSTHDTKRGEDVRARINVLSEIPGEWEEAVGRWRGINASHRGEVHPNDEYLLYQTLVGAWPLGESELRDFESRIQAYMQKALREAKVRTTWTSPNERYEKAVADFVSRLLRGGATNGFIADFVPFQKKVARLGLFNSLSQTLLRLTAPGVPDTYQGSEVWDFSLVDPDNRRAVDYQRRREMLEGLRGRTEGREDLLRELMGSMEDGRVKLIVNSVCLALRRKEPELFSEGEYVPLEVVGAEANRLFAFARRYGGKEVVVLVPRFFAGLVGESGAAPVGRRWEDTGVVLGERGRGGVYTNAFSFEPVKVHEDQGSVRLRVEEAFATFPWGLLYRA